MSRAAKVISEESRKFWAHVEKSAKEVATWPEWKRGDVSISAPEMDDDERKAHLPEGSDGAFRNG